MAKSKQVQVNISFTEEQIDRIDAWAERFNKQTRGQVVREIFDLYADLYEAAEEAKRSVVLGQLGKASASGSVQSPQRRRL